MTASSSHCFSALERAAGRALARARAFRFAVLAAGALALMPLAAAAAPEGAEVRDVRIEQTDEGIVLDSNIGIELTPRLEEAVSRGVPLYFIVQYELYRTRWYWWDAVESSGSRTYRLTYNALTRQYRVSSGGLQLSFGTLPEALTSIARIFNWKILDASQASVGNLYEGRLRLRLDVSQLPKPFQISAFNNRDWTIDTDWRRFVFTPAAPVTEIRK
jgi:hypothetical protein